MGYMDSLSECNWKSHPLYDDIEISDNGRVLSYKSGRARELKPSDNGRGYLTVSIGFRNPQYIHRLVAETYIPNPNRYAEVNHRDGDKKNNTVDNLEWCDRKYNLEHACELGLNISQKPVRVLETGMVYRSMNECARRIGGTVSGIHDCKSGLHGTHRGYHFEFLDKDGSWYATQYDRKPGPSKKIRIVETGKVYNSITECAKAIKGTVPGICSCMSGRQEKHRGYHFEYVDGRGRDIE